MANEMDTPITKRVVVIDTEKYGVFLDYPPIYDEYNEQKIIKGVEAAVSMIFRSFYGDHRLLPQIEGLFIDITRYKHALDSEYTKMYLNTKVNQALSSVLSGMQPEITIDYDGRTQKMTYNIILLGELEIKVDNGENALNAEIEINKKKFYE